MAYEKRRVACAERRGQEEEPGGQLGEWIPYGYGHSAAAAFPAEYDEAEDRDVVPGLYGLFAARAGAGGETMDLPRGTLQLTTFKKLPMHRPKSPAKTVNTLSTDILGPPPGFYTCFHFVPVSIIPFDTDRKTGVAGHKQEGWIQ